MLNLGKSAINSPLNVMLIMRPIIVIIVYLYKYFLVVKLLYVIFKQIRNMIWHINPNFNIAIMI